MHRLLAIATLLLSASALAHAPRASVGALPFGEPTRIEQAEQAEAAAPEPHALENLSRQQKTAHRAHARLKYAESARANALTHCLILEKWWLCEKAASGESNPTIYIDPDGRVGYLTTLRDKFNETDQTLREWAMNSGDGGYIAASTARGLMGLASVPARALNLASDALAASLQAPGFRGVREEGRANLAPLQEVFNNPADTVFAAYDAAHGREVGVKVVVETVDLQ